MTPPYFPSPSTEYVIVVAILLTALMTAAAWIDWKTWRIPKRLTMGMLGLGIVMQVIGGAWMGSQGRPGWITGETVALGILDGLLLSLAGALTGFAIFFGLWILGVAGGGDVKHAAALGAWVGPKFFLGILIFCMPVVAVMMLITMFGGLAKGKLKPTTQKMPDSNKPGKKRLMSFSLPLAVATFLVFLVIFRVPLGLSAN